jgi:ectoine hydroxylase-related dioxygenase (phytanoyl-CoA dioxygenase family)
MLSASEEIEAAVRSSPLAQVVAKTMNSSIATAFYVSIFARSAGTSKPTPWHQDLPYWAADGQQACSTWIPLDPVPRSTALEFVRGSHLWDVFGRPDFSDQPREGYLPDENTRAEPFPDIESNRAGYDIIGWEMTPGDGLLFHGMTAHGGSGRLLPGLGRRTISVQWLGDDGFYSPKEGSVDPDFTAELTAAGLRPGDPVVCDLCPVLWSER